MPTRTEMQNSYNLHVAQAKAIVNAFEGKSMPAEAAHQAEQHLLIAEGLRSKLNTESPDYISPDGPSFLGGSVDGGDWNTADAKALDLAPEQKVAEHVGAKVDESKVLAALGQYVLAQVVPTDPAKTSRILGAVGAKDMLSSGGAGVLVPAPIASDVIDKMRSATVCIQAGARTRPMSSATVKMPRITGDPTPQWLNEGATLTASDATLDSVTLTARRLDAETKISMELSEDSDPVDIGSVVRDSLAAAFALEVDRVALRGSGTAPEPRGILNTTGVTTSPMGTNGGAVTFSTLISLMSTLAGANVDVQNDATFLFNPRSVYSLSDQHEGGVATNAFIQPPPNVATVWNRSLMTTAIPKTLSKGTSVGNVTEIYLGDFSQMVIGVRVGFSLQVATELHRAEGKIGLFARMRADVGLRQPAAFAVIPDVTN